MNLIKLYFKTLVTTFSFASVGLILVGFPMTVLIEVYGRTSTVLPGMVYIVFVLVVVNPLFMFLNRRK